MKITFGSTRRNLTAIGIFFALYAAFGLFLMYSQESIIYLPDDQSFDDCPELPDGDRFLTQGTRMYVNDNGPHVVVLYHGNAGSACDRAFLASIFAQLGYSYVLPEYTGYSNDAVRPSHHGVKADVEHVISFLEEREFERITVIGESIGTGAASYHASKGPPSRLILISPFTSLSDVARKRFWFYPTFLMVDDAFNNVELLSKYRGEIDIIHGSDDTIIPVSIGEKLFAALPSQEKNFTVIDDAGHNTLFNYPQMYDALRKALQ